MVNYINNYKQEVVKIIKDSENITKLVTNFKNYQDSERLNEIVKQLDNTVSILEKDHITISVVATFATGKSSFINALLFGDEILHSSVGQTTLKIYKIQYGEQIKITYKENKGNEIVKNLSSYDELKSEIKNLNRDEPHKLKQYDKFVNVFIPNNLLKQGLIIIDTPGLNSIDEEFIKSYVEDALIESDAVIFITNIDQGANKQDEEIWREYFKQIQPESKRWILLNKLDSILTNDMLDDSEKKEQTEKSLETFSKTINKDSNYKKFRIYPISARFALIGKKKGDSKKLEQSNLPSFEKDLFKSLTETRYKDFIQPEIDKIKVGLSDLNFIFSEKGTEIKKNIKFLEDRKSFTFEQGARIKSTINEINSKVNTLKTNLKKINPIVETEFKSLKDDLTKEFELLLIKNLDSFGYLDVFSIKKSITSILNNTCNDFEKVVNSKTRTLSNNISGKFKDILSEYESVIKLANRELESLKFDLNDSDKKLEFSGINNIESISEVNTDSNFLSDISKSIGTGIAIDTAIAAILNYLAKNLGVELAKQILARIAINGVPVVGQIIALILTAVTIWKFPGNVKDKVKNEALPKVKKELISNIDTSTNEIKNKIITINNMLIDKVKEVNSHLETAKIKSSNDIDEINKNITTYKNDLTSVESIFSSLKKININ